MKEAANDDQMKRNKKRRWRLPQRFSGVDDNVASIQRRIQSTSSASLMSLASLTSSTSGLYIVIGRVSRVAKNQWSRSFLSFSIDGIVHPPPRPPPPRPPPPPHPRRRRISMPLALFSLFGSLLMLLSDSWDGYFLFFFFVRDALDAFFPVLCPPLVDCCSDWWLTSNMDVLL